MPSVIYLSSSDEFVVTMDHDKAEQMLEADTELASFTAIRWFDPDEYDADDLSGPSYSETPIIVRTAHIIAVRKVAKDQAESIDRASAHQLLRLHD